MSTMNAWQWTGTGKPLALHEVPVPVPGPTDVLVRVRAAGICHTDVGQLDEPAWVERIELNPITLGHEIAGVVEAVGSAVDMWAPGDRVAVNPSRETTPGFSRDGGYATYSLSPAADLVRVPAGLDFDLAAISTDAGMTSHHAVVRTGGAEAGSRVGIIGLGGLGQIGAQIAVSVGAEVHAADPSPAARALAEDWGMTTLVQDPADLAGLELDVVVDFAGFGSTTMAAVRAIRVGGTVVQVGMGAEETVLVPRDIVHQHAVIRGSQGGDSEDIAAVQQLLLAGTVRPRIEHVRFEQLPEGLERLRAGTVTGRLVTAPPDPL